ncbi:MAG: polysaccharide deacetylase family protein [Chitinophagaceae bacterium]
MTKNRFIKIGNYVSYAFLILFATACNNNKVEETKNNTDTVKTATNEVKPGTPIAYDNSKRYIYLTWDDGPQPPGTNNCKYLFEEQGVKATFFIVGMNHSAPKRIKLIDSIRQQYPQFLLANHSHTHAFRENYKKFYSSVDSAVNEFVKAQDDMRIPLKIIRLPGNNSWVSNGDIKGPKSTLAVCKGLDSLGFKVIGWDIEWQFKGSAPKQTGDEILKQINDKFETGYLHRDNHLVILAHDRMFQKPEHIEELRKVIATLKQDGRYVFETIDHYPTVQGEPK